VSRTDPEPYRKLASDNGVADRVSVWPPTNSIERYYGAADALVLPTPYDAFGMVITEAMACGVPPITTRLAGASELLTDGVHGLLVDSPNDVQGIAVAMNVLAGDHDLRIRMGAAAAALMRDHTWDRVADQTLSVYYRHLALQKNSGAGA
jgi:glycosyltransferase involved in cell wall biosynthesis